MFSVPDITLIGVLALLLFGPDRLPGMMRQAGRLMREVQNTSQSFVAEMERAADVNERPLTPPSIESPPPEEFESLRPPVPPDIESPDLEALHDAQTEPALDATAAVTAAPEAEPEPLEDARPDDGHADGEQNRKPLQMDRIARAIHAGEQAEHEAR